MPRCVCRRSLAVLGALTVLAAAPPIGADPAVAAPAAESSDRERSLDLYEQSKVAYREERFTQAIALLKEAYRLYPSPVLLYNLARAHESAGEDREALDAYQAYLREDAAAPDRAAIEQRVQSIRARLREREREREERRRALARAREAEKKARQAGQERESRVESRDTVLPWLTTGLGVSVLAAGGVFGALAKRAETNADEAPSHRAATESFDEAERHALVANIGFVAGGILTAAGITWLWLGSGSTGRSGTTLRLQSGEALAAAVHGTF